MLFHKFALFLLSLASLTLSAPLTCDQLTQPEDELEPGRLGGTWALVAGSITYQPYLEIFSQRDSGYISFPGNITGTNTSYKRGLKTNSSCVHSSSNITLNGSSFTFDGTPASNTSGTFVQTSCRDCLVMRFVIDEGQRTHLYLFSRRRQLDQAEMLEFKEQAQCHQMPSPTVMDPTKELCLEQD